MEENYDLKCAAIMLDHYCESIDFDCENCRLSRHSFDHASKFYCGQCPTLNEDPPYFCRSSRRELGGAEVSSFLSQDDCNMIRRIEAIFNITIDDYENWEIVKSKQGPKITISQNGICKGIIFISEHQFENLKFSKPWNLFILNYWVEKYEKKLCELFAL